MVAFVPPVQPQEQLNCLMAVFVTIAASMVFTRLAEAASKTTIFASPGAIAIAISISSETSSLPPGTLPGSPLNPPIKIVWMTMFVRPPPAATA